MLPPPKKQPDVIRLLDEYRQELDSRDTALMDQMGTRWLYMENRLQGDIDRLSQEIQRRMLSGETVTQQMIWKMETYKRYDQQMKQMIFLYTDGYAAPEIEKAQVNRSMLGIRSANDALTVQLGQYSSYVWDRINLNAVHSMIGFAQDGSPLKTLLRASYPLSADAAMNSLVESIARGHGAAQIAAGLRDATGMGLNRSILIARTEAARAYRTASTLQYRRSGVVTGFFRLVKKATACMACLMLDGERFELAEELTDHPRGKCGVVADVLGRGIPTYETGHDWFMRLDPAEQEKRMGSGMYQLWKQTGFDIKQLAQFNHSDVWGDSPAVMSLKDMRALLGVTTPPKISPSSIPAVPVVPAAAPAAAQAFIDPADTIDFDWLKGWRKDEAERSLQNIAKVIKLPARKFRTITGDKLPVQIKKLSAHTFGQYGRTSRASAYIRISTAVNKEDFISTFTHEFAHFMDFAFMGEDLRPATSVYGGGNNPDLAKVFKAIHSSEAAKRWKELLAADEITLSGYRYVNSDVEYFARAFEQYIANKTGDYHMLENVAIETTDGLSRMPYQWNKNDFIPIEKALDDMFGGLGWLR